MGLFSQLLERLRGGRTAQPSSQHSANVAALPERADWLVIGLGNPGREYENTRHNVGYMAVDSLLSAHGVNLQPLPGFKASAATVTCGDQTVVVIRSTTYMNLSGEAVAPLAARLGVEPGKVICLHDELDLPHGTVRLKSGGNENGHNGLKSLSQELGTRDYVRVRMGIGRPAKGASIPDYVLGPVDSGAQLDECIKRAAQAVELIATQGLIRAQNQVH